MNEFRDRKVIRGLIKDIREKAQRLPAPVRIMEVCGTHTMAVHRYGLKPQLEEAGVSLVSGPGCPVCITPDGFHEASIGLVSRLENLILATFGDMTRVPTRTGSLQTAIPARNSKIKTVYSPQEALEIARMHPEKDVVFLGVGFETTIPAIAMTVKQAHRENIRNYAVLTALWVIPPPLRAILDAGEIRLGGFLYPGHVSAIIGIKPYEFIPAEYGLPGAVAGFEPADILLGILSVLDQAAKGKPRVAIEYARVVRPEGNPLALALMNEMLQPKDAVWRGLGPIPKSGLRLREKYGGFDAEKKYGLALREQRRPPSGCRCGEVLRGVLEPPGCPLFSRKCTPGSPYGPCMVSFEGSCYVHYKYGYPERKRHEAS